MCMERMVFVVTAEGEVRHAEGGVVITGRAPDIAELVNTDDTVAATHDIDIIADTELHIIRHASSHHTMSSDKSTPETRTELCEMATLQRLVL